MVSNHRLAQALRKVPETKLAILELYPRILGPDGRLDQEAAKTLTKKLDKATEEAQQYAQETRNTRGQLSKLSPAQGAYLDVKEDWQE